MKKKVLCLIAIFMVFAQASFTVEAKSSVSNPTKVAIRKYKIGNYTGCLQDCQYIVRRDPSNSVAYYYMAMSYVQAGKKDEAIGAYSRVLSLNPTTRLSEYATTGKRCLETPDKCILQEPGTPSTDVDKFIATPSGNLSDTVKTDMEQKHLQQIKNEVNNNKELDNYQFRKFKDYTDKHSQAESTDAVAQKKPSNDEVVAALKVLNAAGLNPYSQVQQVSVSANQVAQPQAFANPYAQAANYQNPEMAQLSSLLGNNNQSNDSNSMANMIPFMLAQNKNGSTNYSPQVMQSVIMNSMMSNFSVDTDSDKNK